MAPSSSSSTKKAAKLAQSGQGKKVRFQGGTLFPMVVALVVVLGLGLVVYARQSRPAADASSPTVQDHWHVAYGFYLCDQWVQLTGNQEDESQAGFDDFRQTGIHSHDDGIIHWHPSTSRSVGRNAKLSVFLDVYGVELTNDKLTFPESQRAQLPEANREDGVFEEGETQCDVDGAMEDGELKVIVWDNFTDTDDGTTYIADFDNIRVDQDAMVFSIVFAPADTDVGMPPWAPDLPTLGAADSGQVLPTDPLADIAGSTLPGAAPSTVAPSATIPGAAPIGVDSTVPGTASTGTEPPASSTVSSGTAESGG